MTGHPAGATAPPQPSEAWLREAYLRTNDLWWTRGRGIRFLCCGATLAAALLLGEDPVDQTMGGIVSAMVLGWAAATPLVHRLAARLPREKLLRSLRMGTRLYFPTRRILEVLTGLALFLFCLEAGEAAGWAWVFGWRLLFVGDLLPRAALALGGCLMVWFLWSLQPWQEELQAALAGPGPGTAGDTPPGAPVGGEPPPRG